MKNLTRRSFLNTSFAGAVTTLALPSLAEQSFQFGANQVEALSDGTFTFPNAFWAGASEAELAKLGEHVTFGANVFLIRRGDRTFLIDVGAGDSEFITSNFPTVGKLPSELASIGVDPSEVTDVVITHMHADHFGGVVKEGRSAFKNATIHLDRSEWEFWTREGFATQAPEALRQMVVVLQSTANVVQDQVQLHGGDTDLGNGVTSLKSYGHTPGHNSFMLDLGAEQVLVLGDIVVSDHIHFANPAVGWAFDADPVAAEATRRRLLDMAASDNLIVAANHVSTPGMGRIERSGKAFEFIAL